MADSTPTSTPQTASGSNTSGPAVDKAGNAAVDPTKNVLDLVSAAIARQDDLRDVTEKYTEKIASLRAYYDDKLREAESKRIDAIRAVDVGNVQRAAEVQATQAATLAAQVTASAEALRTQVIAASTAATIALNAALDPIQKRIDDLTRAQYEAQGQKTQVVESDSRAGVNGMWIGLVFGAIGTVFGLIGLVLALTR